MFGSDAFRLVFWTWPFLRSLTIASLCGLVISLGLSIWCRMRFGRGVASQRTWSLSETPTREADPFAWIVAANSKAEDEVMPWDFSNSTEKAWQAFEPNPGNHNNLQGQPQSMNGMLTGTAYRDVNALRV
jgi:hypothetical protein